MPPAVNRMLTPDILSEIAKSACVTWRAQPPFWIRLGALLNDVQNCGRSPTSVGGGLCAAGNWRARSRFCGPGSAILAGFVALTAPCGGSSGLPKEPGRAATLAAEAIAPAAAALNMTRLENMALLLR